MRHLLNDQLHFPKIKKIHNSIIVTKMLRPDISITQLLEDICQPLSRQYEVKREFGFIALKYVDDDIRRQ